MSLALSVITCSHNPRPDYLRQVLEALNKQTLDKQRWEYLLIDNNSNERLDVRIDISWHPRAEHVREEKLGLTHARLRGIEESIGEILVFVDDDNVLDADYLEQTLNVASEWPKLGAWSGQTNPVFESPPPEWTKRYWGNLAIRGLAQDSWSNMPHLPETMPCGAGLCVRRSVATHYAHLHASGKRQFILDRTGNSLVSAGDNDLAACACDIGLGVGLFVALKLTHLIPTARLQEDYLLMLTEGIAYSGVMFRSMRSSPLPKVPGLSTRIADFLRQVRMGGRDRRFFRAYKRGEAKAYEYLATNSNSVVDNNAAPHQAAT